jgi:magnesium-transporting ATPase (P-type)
MSQYWHSLTTEEVLDTLKTSRSGLSEDEVADRQEQYGINLLTKKKGNSVLKLLWQQLSNPLIYVLLVAIALAFLMGKVTDAFVILSVVLINTFIGFLQECGRRQDNPESDGYGTRIYSGQKEWGPEKHSFPQSRSGGPGVVAGR